MACTSPPIYPDWIKDLRCVEHVALAEHDPEEWATRLDKSVPVRLMRQSNDFTRITIPASVVCVRRFWDKVYVRLRLPMVQEVAALMPFDAGQFEILSEAKANGMTLNLEY